MKGCTNTVRSPCLCSLLMEIREYFFVPPGCITAEPYNFLNDLRTVFLYYETMLCTFLAPYKVCVFFLLQILHQGEELKVEKGACQQRSGIFMTFSCALWFCEIRQKPVM